MYILFYFDVWHACVIHDELSIIKDDDEDKPSPKENNLRLKIPNRSSAGLCSSYAFSTAEIIKRKLSKLYRNTELCLLDNPALHIRERSDREKNCYCNCKFKCNKILNIVIVSVIVYNWRRLFFRELHPKVFKSLKLKCRRF